MTPQEMQRRIAMLEELLERWAQTVGGCYVTYEDEEPPTDCPCIYCTTIRVLDGEAQ